MVKAHIYRYLLNILYNMMFSVKTYQTLSPIIKVFAGNLRTMGNPGKKNWSVAKYNLQNKACWRKRC
jgi:hypothetical protein